MKHLWSACILFLLTSLSAAAQGSLQKELEGRKTSPRYAMMHRFYTQNGHGFAWLSQRERAEEMIRLFHLAPSLALRSADYERPGFSKWLQGSPLTSRDSFRIDIDLTESALRFFMELKGGNRMPSFGYEGARFQVMYEELPVRLHEAITGARLGQLAAEVQPDGQAYLQMIALLRRLQSLLATEGFRERFAMVQAADHNPVLWERIHYFGLSDSLNMPSDAALRLKIIRQAQRFFDGNDDGRIRSSFITAINLPLSQRVKELAEGINLVRWTEAWQRQPLNGLLNIPSATAQITHDHQTVLFSRVIVGKSTARTPTLTSVIREVVLYPYWYVPRNIAVKELLPGIRRNIGYLEENRYQVLNDQGKVLDPYSINWSRYNASYFPFTIRQSTGCDNSLGLFKFQFDNPFSVYWHDTPNKGLFALNKRYLSHGCMRFEKAEELGQFLLGANRIAIDTVTEKGCLLNQRPIVLPVAKPMPIAVVYSTVWLDAEGRLRFYDDVYRRRR